jgi:hypothetical protein
VAVISGVTISRQDAAAVAEGSTPPPDAAAPQLHAVSIWPQCEEGPSSEPLVQHALQLAEPLSPLALGVSVLPSEMPAELLMTYQGEVCLGTHMCGACWLAEAPKGLADEQCCC